MERKSTETLNVITKMTIDIAEYRCKRHEYDLLHAGPSPPTTVYIMKMALRHLSADRDTKGDVALKHHRVLSKSLSNFQNRWGLI